MNNFDDLIRKKLGTFPVGAWVPYYYKDLSPEWLRSIRECGINFIPVSNHSDELDLVAASGLKALVSDDRVVYANVGNVWRIGEWIKEYVDREEVLGLFVWDEPSPLMQKICGTINREIQRVAPETFGYINLHPSYSEVDEQRNGLSYEDYLEHFVAVSDPKLISFDHYPFLQGRITDDYFYNLRAIRNCCDRHGLGFWSFIQTCSFGKNVTPTAGQMTWQAYTNLAYGAKGLLYFTYATVQHEKNFGTALADVGGTRTPRWYAAEKINCELNRLGNILLGLRSRAVKFFGYDEADVGGTFRALGGVSGGPALVGCFEDAGGNPWLLPVNLDAENPARLTVSAFGKEIGIETGAGEGKLISPEGKVL